jgi:ribose/xylose/arabinose/galactoside ABC-type transport system permease subunit
MAVVAQTDKGSTRNDWLATFIGQYFIQLLLLLAVIILAALNSNFRQLPNLRNVLLQASFAGISAAAMTLLMIAGAFDLSVAGLLGFCGVVLALLLPQQGVWGIVPAVLAALLLGGLLGLVNGVVVTKARIPAFIATLGMMNIYLALGFIPTNAQVVPVTNSAFRTLGTGVVLGLPVPFLVMVVMYLIAHVILKYTAYGRFMRAVGSNQTASRTAGLPVDRVRIVAFVLVGLFTALAGVLLTALLSSANAIMATGFELNVIAVVVVGGTSLTGGRGTLFGSFTGALLFSVINNALNMFGVGAYWQYVAVGLVLIIALGIEAGRKRLMGATRT